MSVRSNRGESFFDGGDDEGARARNAAPERQDWGVREITTFQITKSFGRYLGGFETS